MEPIQGYRRQPVHDIEQNGSVKLAAVFFYLMLSGGKKKCGMERLVTNELQWT